MGPFEVSLLGGMEGTVKYHPDTSVVLISCHETGWETGFDGQFNWGGFLLNCNGEVQRSPQRE